MIFSQNKTTFSFFMIFFKLFTFLKEHTFLNVYSEIEYFSEYFVT